MDWRDLAATKEFFRELHREFDACLNDGWYMTYDPMVVQKLRGQRDVFEAIRRLLTSEDSPETDSGGWEPGNRSSSA